MANLLLKDAKRDYLRNKTGRHNFGEEHSLDNAKIVTKNMLIITKTLTAFSVRNKLKRF